MGHEVRLIPSVYVKPFAKRNKSDAVDAEAICEAAQRPNMRLVAIKSEEQQASVWCYELAIYSLLGSLQKTTPGMLPEPPGVGRLG